VFVYDPDSHSAEEQYEDAVNTYYFSLLRFRSRMQNIQDFNEIKHSKIDRFLGNGRP